MGTPYYALTHAMFPMCPLHYRAVRPYLLYTLGVGMAHIYNEHYLAICLHPGYLASPLMWVWFFQS